MRLGPQPATRLELIERRPSSEARPPSGDAQARATRLRRTSARLRLRRDPGRRPLLEQVLRQLNGASQPVLAGLEDPERQGGRRHVEDRLSQGRRQLTRGRTNGTRAEEQVRQLPDLGTSHGSVFARNEVRNRAFGGHEWRLLALAIPAEIPAILVSRVRIELTTRGFSIHCSTD